MKALQRGKAAHLEFFFFFESSYVISVECSLAKHAHGFASPDWAGGQYLEMLGNIDTMVFDKTGTLTSGSPTVADVFVAPNTLSQTDFARTLLAIESRSEHPIGHAVVEYAEALLKKGSDWPSGLQSNNAGTSGTYVSMYPYISPQRVVSSATTDSPSAISESLPAAGSVAFWTARKVRVAGWRIIGSVVIYRHGWCRCSNQCLSPPFYCQWRAKYMHTS